MSDLIPLRLVVGVALATAGQVLNGGVYNALGKQPCRALKRICGIKTVPYSGGDSAQVSKEGLYVDGLMPAGKAGVYYGVKFGLSIPWYEGFPFTVVKHPQYVGCILTIWGMVSIFFAPEYIDLGLLTVASVWTMYYMFSGFIENTF
jgi:protein-S-isoprenylcysteine O-methyltransferase Ste14